MRVLCVDDSHIALQSITQILEEQNDVASVSGFTDPELALAWAASHPVDAAFIDTTLQNTDGIAFAKRLRAIHPNCAFVFVTDSPDEAISAFPMHATGYLIKPASPEQLRHEINQIMHPLSAPKTKKRIRVQCFGHFEAFYGDAPLQFERSKTKELLAYLVDRQGSAVNTSELCAVLWELREDTNFLRTQVRTLFFDLTRTLRSVGAEDVLLKSRNNFAIDVDKIDCDYYNFLNREAEAVNQYRGEYMTQYSWAETTLSGLEFK